MKAFAKVLAEQTESSQAEALARLQKVLDGITDTLIRDGRLRLGDFGIFELKLRKARMGRNPRTGEQIAIPQQVYAAFKPGKALRDRVGQLTSVPSAAPAEPTT